MIMTTTDLPYMIFVTKHCSLYMFELLFRMYMYLN